MLKVVLILFLNNNWDFEKDCLVIGLVILKNGLIFMILKLMYIECNEWKWNKKVKILMINLMVNFFWVL